MLEDASSLDVENEGEMDPNFISDPQEIVLDALLFRGGVDVILRLNSILDVPYSERPPVIAKALVIKGRPTLTLLIKEAKILDYLKNEYSVRRKSGDVGTQDN